MDYEFASKKAATKNFLKTDFSLKTQKPVVLGNHPGPVNDIVSGDILLKLASTTGTSLLQAEELSASLTRQQLQQKMSFSGQNTKQEQLLIADCRYLRDGQISGCDTFLNLATSNSKEDVDLHLDQLKKVHC